VLSALDLAALAALAVALSVQYSRTSRQFLCDAQLLRDFVSAICRTDFGFDLSVSPQKTPVWLRQLERWVVLTFSFAITAQLLENSGYFLLFYGRTRFKEFAGSPEGIPTNILTDRLERLLARGVIEQIPAEDGTKRLAYCLTKKGKALGPVLKTMRDWGLTWDKSTRVLA
jgi:hypothetical protein